MRYVSETKGLKYLERIQADLRAGVAGFEERAQSCSTCKTPGACCLDEHFVNVHISRVEAVSINRTLSALPDAQEIRSRIEASIERYGLSAAEDTFSKTYACPLYSKSAGCLVHTAGKPVPCLIHACYERKEDLPPDELQMRAEEEIRLLNEKIYGRSLPLLPLPIALLATSENVAHDKS